MIKSLSTINQRSGLIPMLDCIVVMKYPIYFSEFFVAENGSNQRIFRNKLSLDYLQSRQQERFTEKVRSMMDKSKSDGKSASGQLG